MKKITNGSLATVICALGISSPQAVLAQDAEGSAFVLEEILVTAQRRTQNIQDVANSITALSGAEMDALGKVGFEDYISGVGGIGFTRNGNGSVKVGLRGVSAVAQDQYAFATTVSTTGLYLDDVPIQGAGALPDLNLYDLQRIEVLKGPQGTLYGEGAMGGAIKVLLNKPDLTAFEAKAEASAISIDNADLGYRVRGAVNIPIVEDRIAARIVGSTEERKGFIDNVATGEDGVNDVDSWSLRGSLLAQINEDFSVELLAMHDQQENDGFPQEVDNLGDLETDLLEDEFNEIEIDLYALTLKYDLGFAELTSVTSYFEQERDFATKTPLSIDEIILPAIGLPPFGFSDNEVIAANDYTETFTQEVRLVSQGDEVLDWTLGAFYRDRDREICTYYDSPAAQDMNDFLGLIGLGDFVFPPTTFNCELTPPSGLDTLNRTATETYEQYAVYGEVNWEFAERFELTVGGRYFDEEVEFTDNQAAFGLFSFLTVPEATSSTTDSDVLMKAGISWKATDDQLYYFNVAEGFRSGGSNLNAADTTDPDRFRAFDSDDLINYELGAKTNWLDGRLTLNGALYYTEWSDVQTEIFVPAVTVEAVAVLTSGGDAEITGAEIELNYLPTENLSLGLTVTAQDTEFTDPAADANIAEDSQLPNAPDLTASLFAQYTMTTSFGDLFGRVAYRYVDEQRTVVEPAVPLTIGYDDDTTILDSYDVVDLTIGLSMDRWYITGFVQNLTDERYALDYGYGQSFVISGGNPNMTAVGTPRTMGLTVGTTF